MTNPTGGSDAQFMADLARVKAMYGQAKYRYADLNKASYLEERYGLDWNARLKEALNANAAPQEVANSVVNKTFKLPETSQLSLKDAQAKLDATLSEDQSVAQGVYGVVKGTSRAAFSALEAPIQVVSNTLVQAAERQAEVRGTPEFDFSLSGENIEAAKQAFGAIPGILTDAETYTNTDIAIQVGNAFSEGFSKGFGEEATGSGFFIADDSTVGLEKEARAKKQWTLPNGDAATLGRAFATGMDIDKDSAWYGISSGAVDFTLNLVADPLNAIPVGKVGSVGKLAGKTSKLADNIPSTVVEDLVNIDADTVKLADNIDVVSKQDKLKEARYALADELYKSEGLRTDFNKVKKEELLQDKDFSKEYKDYVDYMAFEGGKVLTFDEFADDALRSKYFDEVFTKYVEGAAEELSSADTVSVVARNVSNILQTEGKQAFNKYVKETDRADFIARKQAEAKKAQLVKRDELKAKREELAAKIDEDIKARKVENKPDEPDNVAHDSIIPELSDDVLSDLRTLDEDAFTDKYNLDVWEYKKLEGFKKIDEEEALLDAELNNILNSLNNNNPSRLDELIDSAESAREELVKLVSEVTGRERSIIDAEGLNYSKIASAKAGITENKVKVDETLSYFLGNDKVLSKLYEDVSKIQDKYTIWKVFGETLDDNSVRALANATDTNDIRVILAQAMFKGDLNRFNKRSLKRLVFGGEVEDTVYSTAFQRKQAFKKAMPSVVKINYDDSSSVVGEMDRLIDYVFNAQTTSKAKLEKAVAFKKTWLNKMLEAQTASQRKQVFMTSIDPIVRQIDGFEKYSLEDQVKIVDRIKRDIGYSHNYENVTEGVAKQPRVMRANVTDNKEKAKKLLDVGSSQKDYSDNAILDAEKLNFNSPSLDIRNLRKAIHAGVDFESGKGKYVSKNALNLFNEAYDRYVKPGYLVARPAYSVLNTIEGSTRNALLGYSNIFQNPSLAFTALFHAAHNPDTTIGAVFGKLAGRRYQSVDELALFTERAPADDLVYAARRIEQDTMVDFTNSNFNRELDKTIHASGSERKVGKEKRGYDIIDLDDIVDEPRKHKQYYDAVGETLLSKSVSDVLFNLVYDVRRSAMKAGLAGKETAILPKWLEEFVEQSISGKISYPGSTTIGSRFNLVKLNHKGSSFHVVKTTELETLATEYIQRSRHGRDAFKQLWGARYENVPGNGKVNSEGFTIEDIGNFLFRDVDGSMSRQVDMLTAGMDSNIVDVIDGWRKVHAVKDAKVRNRTWLQNRKMQKGKDVEFKDPDLEFNVNGETYTYTSDQALAAVIGDFFKARVGSFGPRGAYKGIRADLKEGRSIPRLIAKRVNVDAGKEKFNLNEKYERVIVDLLTLASEPEKLLAHQPFLHEAYLEAAASKSMFLTKEAAEELAVNTKNFYKGKHKTKRVAGIIKQLEDNAKQAGFNDGGLTSFELHQASVKEAMRSLDKQFYGVHGRNQFAAKFSIFAPFIQAAVNTGMFYGRNAVKPAQWSKLNKAQIAWTNLQSEDSGQFRQWVPGLSKGDNDRRPLVWVNDFGDKLVTIPFFGFDVNTAMWNPLTYTDNPMQIVGPGVTFPATILDNTVVDIPADYRTVLMGNTATDPTRDSSFLRELTPSVVQQVWRVWESRSTDHIGQACEAVLASDPDKYYKYTESGTPYLDDEGKNLALEDAKNLSFGMTLWQQLRTNFFRGGTSQERIIKTVNGEDLSVQVLLDEFHEVAASSPNGRAEAYRHVLDKYGPQAVSNVISVNKPAFDGSREAFEFSQANKDLFNKGEDIIGLFFPNKSDEPDSDFARLVNDAVYSGKIQKTPEELQNEINTAFMNAEKARILDKYQKGYISKAEYDAVAAKINLDYVNVKKTKVESYNRETYNKLLELSKDERLADTDTAKAFLKLHAVRENMIAAGLVTGNSFAGASEQETANRAIMRQVGEDLVKQYPGFTNAWFYALRNEYEEQ